MAKEYSMEWWESQKGNEVPIDDNYCDCGTWTVGEGRCSCGNRRIYLGYVDSDFYVSMAD